MNVVRSVSWRERRGEGMVFEDQLKNANLVYANKYESSLTIPLFELCASVT